MELVNCDVKFSFNYFLWCLAFWLFDCKYF